MLRKTNTESSAKEQKIEYLPITTFTVESCRVNENCTRVTFTLKIPGAIFPGMKYVCTDQYQFLAPPEDKWSDGKFHKRYYLYLSEEDTQRVIAEVERQVNETEGGEL